MNHTEHGPKSHNEGYHVYSRSGHANQVNQLGVGINHLLARKVTVNLAKLVCFHTPIIAQGGVKFNG